MLEKFFGPTEKWSNISMGRRILVVVFVLGVVVLSTFPISDMMGFYLLRSKSVDNFSIVLSDIMAGGGAVVSFIMVGVCLRENAFKRFLRLFVTTGPVN